MLPSLGIRNYRNLKHLDIEKLARVNLIAGKNNTGKTSLLEAVSLYAAGGSLDWITQILRERGEIVLNSESEENRRLYSASIDMSSYVSLFHTREINFSENSAILIGNLEEGLFDQSINQQYYGQNQAAIFPMRNSLG